jgi:tRNA (guanine-N7-)-methyltransferase
LVARLNRRAPAAPCPVVELIPQTYLDPLDLVATFGRTGPLHVDLGCGDGSFLCELAQKCPHKNFLGIDKMAGRVEKTCRKTVALKNVRVVNVEISYAIRFLLPPASVETFYLLFPDPWPKRRHHRRRLVTVEFLDSIHRALIAGGAFQIATDHLDYFRQIERLGQNHTGFAVVDGNNVDLPATKFEKRFREQGAPVYRLSLRKISPVT